MQEDNVTALRARMLEDMRIRGMGDKAQKSHIRTIKDFAKFLKRSPFVRKRQGFCSSVANFDGRRIHGSGLTQLSSESGKLLKCGSARRLKLLLADHVGDFDGC